MTKEKTRLLYEHEEMDLDYNFYWFMNRDVKPYRHEDKEINAIIDDFTSKSEQWLYIKGAYLYFTLNGVKYYEILTHSTWEWRYINDLIKKLEPLCDNIFYNSGELD